MSRSRCRLLIYHACAILSLGLITVFPSVSSVRAAAEDLLPLPDPHLQVGIRQQDIFPTPQAEFEDEFSYGDDLFLEEIEPQPLPTEPPSSGILADDDRCASRSPGKTERCLQLLAQSGQTPASVVIDGDPLRISASDDTRLGVFFDNHSQFFGGDHSGVFLWLNGKVYGPQPWGGGRDYSRISNHISGDGSPANPWKASTVVNADNILQVTQEIVYVNGQNQIGFNWSIQNLTNMPLAYSFLHAADFTRKGDDFENGYYNPANRAIGGWDHTRTNVQYFVPGTPNSAYFEGTYTDLWNRVGYSTPGQGFNNTHRTDYIDNGAGLQWNNLIPPASIQTVKDSLVFINQNQTNYHISGRVMNSTGMPLVNVTVSASGGYNALTDDEGYYTLMDIPAGRYMLAASLQDYTFTTSIPMPVEVPRDKIMIDFLGTAAGSKAVMMHADLDSIDQNAVYALSGRIADAGGKNLAGVTVTIDATHSGETNSSGYYEIGGLAAGKYTLTPALAGYAFTPAARSVTIPGQTTNLDFTATPTVSYQISGRVTRPGGTVGLIGVKVYADEHHMGLTDGQGSYVISGLYPGTYTVRAVWDGYQFSTMTVMPLTLSADETVDFSGEPNPNWISGKVTVKGTGYPLPGVTVSTGCGYSAVTDAAGQYTISGLSDQTYYVRASLKGYTFDTTPVQVAIPPSQDSVDIVAVPQNNMIQGSLSMSVGVTQPLAGVEITSSSGSTAYTDINGHFSMAGLNFGDHTLTVHLYGFSLSPASIIVTVPTSTDVAITATPNPYYVSGLVTSSLSAMPVAGATIFLGSGRKATSNVNGYYIIAGLPSTSTEYDVSAYLFGHDVALNGITSPITVPPSQIVNFLTTFNSKVGKIEGLILNSNPNEYLTGVLVSAKPVSPEVCSAGQDTFFALSDVNGFYQVGGLAGGEFEVEVTKAGYLFQPSLPYHVYAPYSGLIFHGEAAADSYWVDGHILAVGSGLPGAYIYLREGAGNSTYSNANGYYRIAGLPPGGYTVVPSLNYYTFSTSTVMPIQVGDVVSHPGKTIDFEAANSSSATPMYFVSGVLKTPKGTPVAFVPLTLNPGGLSAISDRSGSYSIGWLTAGTYTIMPANPNSETNCQFVVKKSGSSASPPLQVVLPQTGAVESVTDGDFEVTCTTNVSGKIVDSAGNGVAGITVIAKPSLTGSTITAVSAANGQFILAGLSEGNYAIMPTSSGFRYTPQSFQVNPPVSVSLPEFTAEPLPIVYRISGMVKDADGRPLGGVTISDNAGDMAVTDASGAYELGFAISSLPVGVNELVVVPSQEGFFFTPASRRIPVTPLIGRPPNPTAADVAGIDFRAVMQ